MRAYRTHYMMMLAAAAIAGCSTEDTVTRHDTLQVLAQFNVSVAGSHRPLTRMDDGCVQVGAADHPDGFLGIDDIVLIPFSSATHVGPSTVRRGASLRLKQMVHPVSVAVNNSIPPFHPASATGATAVVYDDVGIGVGTSHFLFYGKAIGAADTPSERFRRGVLTLTGLDADTPSSIAATPMPICTDAPSAVYAPGTVAGHLLDFLNQVASKIGEKTAIPVFADVFERLTQTGGGMRAGSSAAIQQLVQHVYSTFCHRQDADSRALCSYIRSAVDASMQRYVTGVDDATGQLAFNTALLGERDGASSFPACINLPDGAAVVRWNADAHAFEPVTTATNTGLDVASLHSYVYPANLCYRANSAIKVSDNSQLDRYDATVPVAWQTILDAYDDGAVVGPDTRSVALVQTVGYAVARMQLSVQTSGPTLTDACGRAIAVSADEGFPVTAVLVGGQRAVDFEFCPTSASTDEFTIYDPAVAGVYAMNGTAVSANNTLVLQSAGRTAFGDEAAKVNIAVEFLNNTGTGFCGIDGQEVPAGARFYLVACLDPSANGGDCVFEQGKTTEVNLTINTLAKARNTIPDLRMPQMEVGLAVDLQWAEYKTVTPVVD